MGSVARKELLVLGAGISGLVAARSLQERGLDPLLLEGSPSLGGLTRSVKVGDFCFDYTGHLLHLAQVDRPSQIPFAGLQDEDWARIDRRSFCLMGQDLIPAPVQYHIGALRPDVRFEAIASYNTRPALPTDHAPSFREFVISGFGQYLADAFLIPQNERTMATSLDRLSFKAVKRFFPPPDEERVRAGFDPAAPPTEEYNSRFWYPKIGGIERLVSGLAQGIAEPRLLAEIVEIDLAHRTLRTSLGARFSWDHLFSSIPLKQLCALCLDPELRSLAADLSHGALISFNLGVRGAPPQELRDAHWIYVADRSLPFYRVGFYSNISPGMCPPGYASLYVEVGLTPYELSRANIARDVQPRVIHALESLGWVQSSAIVCSVTHIVPCSYVHHTPSRDQLVERILARLGRSEITPIGRYGLWDYLSMEDSMATAVAAVNRVLS